MHASTTGRMSSNDVDMPEPAMPFGLIATMSSLWMNFFIASTMLAAPVSSVSARSSRFFATSGLGHIWFFCMIEAKSPLAEAFATLPGIESGTKPAGGRATTASGESSASAIPGNVESTPKPATAEVVVTNSRRLSVDFMLPPVTQSRARFNDFRECEGTIASLARADQANRPI